MLIEWMEHDAELMRDVPKAAVKRQVAKAKSLRPQERQQIEVAFDEGYDKGYGDNGESGKEYFTQTFETNL